MVQIRVIEIYEIGIVIRDARYNKVFESVFTDLRFT